MKIQIDIRDNISPTLAMACVRKVIEDGKISKGENDKMYYCWLTMFDTNEGDVLVHTRQYRKNDCFMVYKRKTL